MNATPLTLSLWRAFGYVKPGHTHGAPVAYYGTHFHRGFALRVGGAR